MKKILLAIGTLFVLTTTGFANHSFAAEKQILWTVTDKDNQEWCAFPYQTPQQDGILDEHKQLAKDRKREDEWTLCSDYNIDKTDSQILEQYKVGTTVNAYLKGRMICVKEGQEIPCSKKLEDKINKMNGVNTGTTISSGCKIDGVAVNCKTGKPINSITNSGSSLGECKVNGKPVDCEEMMQDFGGFIKAGLWIMLGFGVLSLVGFVFWLVMLIHACSNDIPNKVLWIVLLFLFGIIAAIVYYFAVKRHCTTNYIPPVNTQPYQASVTVGYQEGPVTTFVTPIPQIPPATPPVNPIAPIVNTTVPTMAPSATTPTQTVESMIATSGAGTMSQVPLGSSSSVTPTVPPDQNNTPLQNPPSTSA